MEIQPKSLFGKILIVVVVLIVALFGLVVYNYWDRGEEMPPVPSATVVPDAKKPDAGRAPAAVDVCKESREKLQGLFAYLDRQDYIASRQLTGGTSEHFRGLLARLLEKPPFVLRETDSLPQILQNRAHFYRVLGKKDTLLLRDILRKEGDSMESTFAILYQAMALQEKCKADGPALRVPLQKVYPYVVFFLDTLGGTAYLMRRDSRVRALTRYYCVLLLDQANKQKLNSIGLDIRIPADVLMQDLKGMVNLSRKEEYIETLKTIRAKY